MIYLSAALVAREHLWDFYRTLFNVCSFRSLMSFFLSSHHPRQPEHPQLQSHLPLIRNVNKAGIRCICGNVRCDELDKQQSTHAAHDGWSKDNNSTRIASWSLNDEPKNNGMWGRKSTFDFRQLFPSFSHLNKHLNILKWRWDESISIIEWGKKKKGETSTKSQQCESEIMNFIQLLLWHEIIIWWNECVHRRVRAVWVIKILYDACSTELFYCCKEPSPQNYFWFGLSYEIELNFDSMLRVAESSSFLVINQSCFAGHKLSFLFSRCLTVGPLLWRSCAINDFTLYNITLQTVSSFFSCFMWDTTIERWWKASRTKDRFSLLCGVTRKECGKPRWRWKDVMIILGKVWWW